MGMTIVERIMAEKAGLSRVRQGEVVWADIDVAVIDDVQFRIFERHFQDLGARVWDREKAVVIGDHYLPPSTPHQAEIERALFNFGKAHSIRNVFMSHGVKHQVLPEQGLVQPGRLIVATDSHTNTAGAFGALGVALGPSEVAVAFANGCMWFQVPEVIHVGLKGTPQPGVTAKDAALRILGDRGTSFAQYKALEFELDDPSQLSMDGRMTLCNMSTEMGAKAAIFPADEATYAFYRDRDLARESGQTWQSDVDARYAEVLTLDMKHLEPLVAAPSSPQNVMAVGAFEDVAVDQAFIGSCANANYEDLAAAAGILKGRKVDYGVQCIVTPASRGVYLRGLDEGIIGTLIDAGCVVTNPGCGACPGVHMGTLGAGHVRISSQNRNFTGRGGHKDSQTYIASAETVAASAVCGHIADPREFVTA